MKKISICLFILSISTGIFAQPRWRQKNARVNFAITPQAEIMKVAGKFSPIASLNASVVFNETWFAGVYGSKKVLPMQNEFDVQPGVKFDANFQHVGVELMYAMKLGLRRTKGGHYVPTKMKVTYSARVGGGLVWLDDENGKRASESDYFYYAQPMVGILWPINDFLYLNAGGYYSVTLKINKLDAYFNSGDFMGPGAFIGLKIKLFR